jgi:hypothetical protein
MTPKSSPAILTDTDNNRAVLVFLDQPLPVTIYGGPLTAEEMALLLIREQQRSPVAPSWDELTDRDDPARARAKCMEFFGRVEGAVSAANAFARACGSRINGIDDEWVDAAMHGCLPSYAAARMWLREKMPSRNALEQAVAWFHERIISQDGMYASDSMAEAAFLAAETTRDAAMPAFLPEGATQGGPAALREGAVKMLPCEKEPGKPLLDKIAPWWARHGAGLGSAPAPDATLRLNMDVVTHVSLAQALAGATLFEKSMGHPVADVIGYGENWRWFMSALLTLPDGTLEKAAYAKAELVGRKLHALSLANGQRPALPGFRVQGVSCQMAETDPPLPVERLPGRAARGAAR